MKEYSQHYKITDRGDPSSVVLNMYLRLENF